MGIAREYVVVLTLILFIPMPSVFSSSVNYVIGAFVVVCVAIYLWYKQGYGVDVGFCYLFISAFVCWSVALVLNITHVDVYVVLREIYKLVFYFLLYYVALKYLMKSGFRRKISVDKVVYLFVIGQLIIVLLQSSTLGAGIMSVMYGAEKLSAGVSLYSDKVRYTGSLGNPNYLSFFFCFVGAWLCAKNKYNFIHILLFLFLVIGLIMTGSRTGIIVFLVLILIRFIVFLPIVGLVLLYNWGVVLDGLVQVKRFDELLSFEKFFFESTFAIRMSLASMAWGFVEKKPFFGYFEIPMSIPDNLYMLIFLRYGVIGLMVLMAIVLYSIYRWRVFFISKSFFYSSVVILMFSSTGAFLDNPRFYGFVVLCLMMFIYDEKFGVVIKKNQSSV